MGLVSRRGTARKQHHLDQLMVGESDATRGEKSGAQARPVTLRTCGWADRPYFRRQAIE